MIYSVLCRREFFIVERMLKILALLHKPVQIQRLHLIHL